MKLISLKLNTDFRSLSKGFNINFVKLEDSVLTKDDFSPYVLAGRNGSGKSNVLEVLAAIFYHLDCQYIELPKSFKYDPDTNINGFRGEKASPNAFELEYLIQTPKKLAIEKSSDKDKNNDSKVPNISHIRVIKTQSEDIGAQLYWLNHSSYGSEKSLTRTLAAQLLPEAIIGYSSGENEVLSLPFFKMRYIQYDEYLQSLKQDDAYDESPLSKLIYLDNEYSQAILLSNLLLQDKLLLKPFAKEVGISGIQQFRIILKRNIGINEQAAEDFNPKFLTKEEEVFFFDSHDYKLNILAKFQSTIDKLTRCASTYFIDKELDLIYLDYFVNNETSKAFKNNFSSPIDLFEKLNLLLNLNLYSTSENLKSDLYQSNSLYVSETVPVLASDQRVMRFKDLKLKTERGSGTVYLKNLSDGEHQFLHSLGICMLYRDKNCLFLFDEPDTHFNPSWRAQFISSVKDCFSFKEQAEDNKSQNTTLSQRDMLITTHSPFLISDSKQDKVLVFNKQENGSLSVKNPEYKTLGASIDQITMLTLQKGETIGGVAKAMMDSFKKRFDDGEDKERLLDEINRDLGDSLEKLFLIRTIQGRAES